LFWQHLFKKVEELFTLDTEGPGTNPEASNACLSSYNLSTGDCYEPPVLEEAANDDDD
jgi:hypothetical protein